MTLRHPPSKTRQLLTVLLLVAMLSSAWPTASATHVNDQFAVPTPSDFVPQTGIDAVDDRVGTVTGPADDAAQEADDRGQNATDEPQVPATYFHDGLDLLGEDHIGGWGVWQSTDLQEIHSGTSWDRGVLPGSEREGVAFGDDEGYAVATGVTLQSALVSPRISLDALPSDSSTGQDLRGPQQVQAPGFGSLQTGTPTTTQNDRIALTLTHRYNLECINSAHTDTIANPNRLLPIPVSTDPNAYINYANQAMGVYQGSHSHTLCDHSSGQTGSPETTGGTCLLNSCPRVRQSNTQGNAQDFGRAWVFTNTPPTPFELANPGSRGQLLSGGSQPEGAQGGFSGQSGQFGQSTWDLTPLAGQDVWLLFETSISNKPQHQFQNSARFDRDAGFYGWQIDDVLLEGPAYVHNVKVDQLLQPNTLLDAGHAPGFVVGPGPETDQLPLAMVVLNRGQVTEDVQPALTLTDTTNGTTVTYPTTPVTLTLAPGETRAFAFDESLNFLREGRQYTATFETRLLGADDMYPTDNQVQVQVQAQRDPGIEVTRPLVIDPPAGDASDPRQVAVSLKNTGHGVEQVDVELAVEYHDRDPAKDPEDDASWETVDNVLTDPIRPIVLVPGEERRLTWDDVRLTTPGSYRFTLFGVADVPERYGDVTVEAVANATTLFGSPPVYVTNFTDDDGWDVVHVGDTLPPCESDPVNPCTKVLEMPSQCSQQCKTLVATVDTTQGDAPEWGANTPIQSFRIDVTQWRDAPCRRTATNAGTLWCHRVTWNGGQTNQPPDTIELWHQGPVQGNPMVTLQTHVFTVGGNVPNTHPANRLGYYDGNWVSETYTASALQLNQQWQTSPQSTIPLGLLDDALNLRFVGRSNVRGGDVDCMTRDQNNAGPLATPILDDWTCPSWRIAYATLVATTAGGQDIRLLQWDGRDPAIGSWGQGTKTQQQADGSVWNRPLPGSVPLGPARSGYDGANTIYNETREGGLPDLIYNQLGENLDEYTGGFPDDPTITDSRPPEPGRGGLTTPSTGWSERFVDTLGPDVTGEVTPLDPDVDDWGDSWTGSSRFSDEGWQRVDTWGQKSGIWTNADGDAGNANHVNWVHSDMQDSILQSPDIPIPADAVQPVLEFDHRFNFPGGWQEHGTLLVRFTDGSDGPATTPWLPVAVRYDHDAPLDPFDASANGLSRAIHRFIGNDCGYYGADHPDAGDCDESDPTRSSATETLPLDRLPILDYRRVQVPGSPQDQEPDRQALRLVDLRDGSNTVFDQMTPQNGDPLCDDTCTVQFGFRVKTGTHGAQGPKGWFIDRFQVLPFPVNAHDISVTGIELDTVYDWPELGLGPGDDRAALTVTVRNEGLFQQPAEGGRIELVVHTQRILPDGTAEAPQQSVPVELEEVLPGHALGVGEAARTATATIPAPIPDDEGEYRILVEAHLKGDILAHAPLADEAPFDNCAGVTVDGDGDPIAVTRQCDITALTPLPVIATPRLSVDVDVEPRAGAKSPLPREVPITIRNTGNVQPEGIAIARSIRATSEDTSQVTQWIDLPSPAIEESMGHLDALQQAGKEVSLTDYWWAFDRDGVYRVVACLKLDPTQPDCHAEDSVVVDSFDPFYVDDFSTSRDPLRNTRIATGDIQAANATGPWQTVTGTGILGDSRGWHFGDHDRQTYPADADESLLLPPLDLSVASQASLSITHQYDFEEGFDGGRLEASLDGGETWRPLTPERGYIDRATGRDTTVYAGNPMQPDNDPLAVTPAWTGSSDGWTTDEFNLGQMRDIIADALLYEFDQEDYRDIDKLDVLQQRTAPGEDGSKWQRASFATSWKHPSTAVCSEDPVADPLLAHCWYRENVYMGTPAPNPAGDDAHAELTDQFWWNSPGNGRPRGLVLNVTLPAKEVDQVPQLSFWAWTDANIGGVNSGNWAGPAAFRFLVAPPGTEDFTQVRTNSNLFTEVVDDRRDGWRHYTFNMRPYQVEGEEVDMQTLFCIQRARDNTQCRPMGFTNFPSGNFRNRGVAVDNVRLEMRDAVSKSLQDIHQHYVPSNDATVWPSIDHPEGRNPAWQIRDSIPIKDSVWNVGSMPDHTGNEARVFELRSYPTDTRERLVTPIIDLGDVGGTQARATFWESYALSNGANQRRVWVQEIIPGFDGGDEAGPWTQVGVPGMGGTSSNSAECEPDLPPRWCQREVDLDDFIGSKIRLGFEMRSPSWGTGSSYWAIDDLQVYGETLAGRPMQLRLRAASDGTVGDGGWTIDSASLVGFSYQDNVAVIPDTGQTEYTLALGETLHITGTARNLGDAATDRLVLQAGSSLTQAETSEPGDLSLDFTDLDLATQDERTLTQVFSLQRAGVEPADRLAYDLRVTAPDGLPADGAVYRLDLEARQVPPDFAQFGVTNPWRDDVLGDHRRVITINVVDDEVLRLDSTDAIHPLTVDPGEPVNITVGLVNEGTRDVFAQALSFNITRVDTGQLVAQSETFSSEVVKRDETGVINWTWVPSTDLPPGFYQVDADYRASYSSTNVLQPMGLVLLGQDPIYYQQSFNVDNLFDAGWISSQSCGQRADCWRILEDFAHSGENSVYVGPDDPLSGATHNPDQDVRMTGPASEGVIGLDLTDLAILDENEFRQSPFNPSLRFQYQSDLGTDDGVAVEVRSLVPDSGPQGWSHLNSDDYTGTPDALGRPALTGTQAVWRPVSVPLGPDGCELNEGTGCITDNALVGNQVELGYRFGSALAGQRGQAFHLDSITVSSYASQVSPEDRDVEMTTGADKVFHFLVENRGPARDTYTIRVAERSNPSVFDIEVLTPEMTLEAGGSGLAEVRVAAPATDLGRGAGGNVILEVVSAGDSNAVSTATLSLVYRATPLADLMVGIKPPDNAEDLRAGDHTSFLVTTQNIATRAESRPTTLVVGTCPWDTGELSADLQTCKADGTWTVIANRAVQGLGPGDAQSDPITWQIPEESSGRFHIVAEADPGRLLREGERSNNVASLPLDVLALDRPHLRVVPGSLQVLRGAEPIHQAVEGDLLRITGQIENIGTTDALGALVILENQFPLLERHLDRVAPGQTVTFSTQWRAEPGNWVVLLNIVPGLGEVQAGDPSERSARWDLAVEGGRIDATLDPETMSLQPGESKQTFLRVVSDAGDAASFVARLEPADNITLAGLPGRFNISSGEIGEYPLQVSASPFAPDGPRTLRISLFTDPDIPPVATATLDVDVSAPQPFSVRADPLATGIGTARIQYHVTNHGSQATSVPLTFEGPDGWQIAAPPPVQVDPGATRRAEVLFTIPDGTPPDTHTITIHSGGDVVATATVDVLPEPRWQTRIEHVTQDESGTHAWVRVENIGNAPGFPLIEVVGGPAQTDVEPPLRVMDAGEVQIFRFRSAPGSSLSLPDKETPVEVPAPDASGSVQAVDVELLSRGPSVPAGERVQVRVALLNTLSEAVPEYPVVLFVNGFPAAETTVSLPASGTTEAELSWVTQSGRHALSVSHGSAAQEAALNEILTVDEADRGVPDVASPALIILLVAVALVTRRQRRP